mmetsp:Transcript_23380/g.26625  ORF Transcript_23380/g.26625 Transcript_23380/m.26625 type:complete len:190 (+) Transcript_23380:88-657(+)
MTNTFLKSLLYLIAFHSVTNAEFCSDGTVCQYASTCIPMEGGYKLNTKREYRCNCSNIDSSSFYAGFGCEYEATDHCILGPSAATGKSYCTNGSCKEKYYPEEGEEIVHKGCNCDDGFEGELCEYLKGEAPIPTSSVVGVVVGVTVSIVFVALVVGAIIITRKIRSRKVSDRDTNRKNVTIRNEGAEIA